MSISVNGITKYYGSQKALDDVSFRAETGMVTAFLGPNGAGKSTMMKIITGFLPASSGEVRINDLLTGTSDNDIKKLIGYLPENNPLYPEMYVREYLGFVASFYKSALPGKKLIDNIIELTGLGAEQKKLIGSLSKGYRQRVGLAQALINDPQVLILDEATTGLDPNQIVEIRNLIREAGKQKTVLLSTHILQEVEAICDRVIVIREGRIVADTEIGKISSLIKGTRQMIRIGFDKEISEEALRGLENVTNVTKMNDNTWLVESEAETDIRPSLFAFATGNALLVLTLTKHESNLEEVFRQLTIK